MTESASDAIISADTAGTIIYWNRGAEKIFGYGEREAVGQPVALLVAERLKKSHERGIARYQATGEAHIIGRPIEQVGVRKDGTEFPVELSINQWKLGGNNFFSAIVRDVSERKQAQEQIRHLLAEAERRLGQMEALHAIDIATANSLDVRFTLKVLIDQVTTHLGIDAADILLHNPHSQKLEFAVGHGFQTKALQYTRLRMGEGYAGRAALERRLVSVPDLKNADGLLPSALVRDEGFVSYFAAPMVAKGDVKGVLEIFHRAPLNADEEWLSFVETLAAQAAIAIDNATLFDNLQRSNTQLALAYDTTLEGWSRALDLRDRETEGHTQRVTEMSVRLARTMGIDEEGLVRIWRGALLHDMGKMAIPDAILLKPGPLDEQEWQSMRKHPVYAHEMLWPIEFLRSALDIPYGHHEKWDGTGYPRGLKGEQIPLHARIFALADIWDALCSDRPYRKAWPKERVIQHIQSLSGSHLDPQVVAQFMQSEFWRDDSVRLAVGSLT
ncbi:MAG: PAS domain S-box protein [Chloroflexi bacterium]|nr:PAS domain S-box protein [Chloroflexota bacterium]